MSSSSGVMSCQRATAIERFSLVCGTTGADPASRVGCGRGHLTPHFSRLKEFEVQRLRGTARKPLNRSELRGPALSSTARQ